MVAGPNGRIAPAILIITLGLGWLLTTQGFIPGIDWVWTLGLAAMGIVVFLVSGGIDKVSVVLGAFFLISSVLSVLRQVGKLQQNTELPILVILIGSLLLVVQLPIIPAPRWLKPLPRPLE